MPAIGDSNEGGLLENHLPQVAVRTERNLQQICYMPVRKRKHISSLTYFITELS